MNELTSSQKSKQRWYQANKEYVKAQAIKKKEELSNLVYQLKLNPCADCGKTYIPFMMDFDHVRGVKVSHISNLVKGGNKQKLLDELDKCELVCANCHRLRTWIRLGKPYDFDVLVMDVNKFDN